MKKCPYCAEEIQDDAIKCRYCGETVSVSRKPEPWYFKTSWVVLAFLCVGPLALPMVWLNPRMSKKTKAIVTIITVVLSWYLGSLLGDSLKSIKQYYELLKQNSF